MGKYDNKYLISHAKKGKIKKEEHSHNQTRRSKKKDYSQFICYNCDEKGHLEIDFPKKKGKKKINNAHSIEDGEPIKKRARVGF